MKPFVFPVFFATVYGRIPKKRLTGQSGKALLSGDIWISIKGANAVLAVTEGTSFGFFRCGQRFNSVAAQGDAFISRKVFGNEINVILIHQLCLSIHEIMMPLGNPPHARRCRLPFKLVHLCNEISFF